MDFQGEKEAVLASLPSAYHSEKWPWQHLMISSERWQKEVKAHTVIFVTEHSPSLCTSAGRRGRGPRPRQPIKLFSCVRAQAQAYVAAHRHYASSGGQRSAGRDSALEHESLTTAECPPAFFVCLGSCLQTHCSHQHTRTTVARAPLPSANPGRARRGLLPQAQHCVSAMHAA